MKLNISRETILPVLERAVSVVENKSTTPVLCNVHINVSADDVRITGTDLDTEISGNINNTGIESSGQTTVSAKKLLDICKALSADSQIQFELNNNTLIVKSGRSTFKLATLPADDFPILDNIPFKTSLNVQENHFLNLIEQTAYAMAQHDVRYYLNGMLLTAGNNEITAVATDGHRLACANTAMKTHDSAIDISIIIPRKGVQELSRLLSIDSETDLELQLSNNHIRLQKDNLRFTSKLIDGKYPDYQAAIPKTTLHNIELDRVQLKETLSRVAILSNEKFRGVLLSLSNGLLTLKSNNPDRETAEETIDINFVCDETFEVGFNINYLLDVINHLTGDTIYFSLNSVESSTLIHSPESPNCMSVVMPVRL